MKVLVDIDILLDVILAREPWARHAAALLVAIESGQIEGHVAGHSITTIHCIVARERDRRTAATAVSDLLAILTVVPMDGTDFHRALALGLVEFEDAVQAAACLKVGGDFLVTRNEKDYRGAPPPVVPRAPGEILALL